jgi:hypothetical protein
MAGYLGWDNTQCSLGATLEDSASRPTPTPSVYGVEFKTARHFCSDMIAATLILTAGEVALK